MEKLPLNTAIQFEKMLKTYRLSMKTCIVAFLLSNVGWVMAYVAEIQKANDKIFVVSDKGTVLAEAKTDETRSVYEMRNHVKTFVGLIFSNNAETFKENIGKGLHLIDRKDGDALYEQFSRAKTLENYQKYNSRSEIQTDSLQINNGTEPYAGLFYGKQIIKYERETVVRPLAFKFDLVQARRSDENPTGLLIRELNFIQYTPKLDNP